jgi:hypothetical protein
VTQTERRVSPRTVGFPKQDPFFFDDFFKIGDQKGGTFFVEWRAVLKIGYLNFFYSKSHANPVS